jgi:hypothetical protein
MPRSPQIGEVTTDRETMEGVGLPLARGIEGELGAVMADKANNTSSEFEFRAERWGGTPIMVYIFPKTRAFVFLTGIHSSYSCI